MKINKDLIEDVISIGNKITETGVSFKANKNAFRVPRKTYTGYGLTAVVNSDYSISLTGKVSTGWIWMVVTPSGISFHNGTPTQSAALLPDTDNFINGNCTLSFSVTGINAIGYQLYSKSRYITNSSQKTYTTSDGINAIVYYIGTVDYSPNYVFKIQIEPGNVATGYETSIVPTINVYGQEIYKAGDIKNQINASTYKTITRNFNFNVALTHRISTGTGRGCAVVGYAGSEGAYGLYFLTWNDYLASFKATELHKVGTFSQAPTFTAIIDSSTNTYAFDFSGRRYSNSFVIQSTPTFVDNNIAS